MYADGRGGPEGRGGPGGPRQGRVAPLEGRGRKDGVLGRSPIIVLRVEEPAPRQRTSYVSWFMMHDAKSYTQFVKTLR